jgi:hypothetical protein
MFMKVLSDKQLFPVAAYAGVIAAFAGVFFSMVPLESSEAADIAFILLAGLTHVLYWYGLGRLGIRLKNEKLHWAGNIALIGSVIWDATVAFTIYQSDLFINHGGQSVIGFGLGLLLPAGMVLAGYAVLDTHKFGLAGTLYGIGSLLCGALFLLGMDLGPVFNFLLGLISNFVLYILGARILMSARR